MSPVEIMEERLRESEQRNEARTQAVTMQAVDIADRTAFQAKAAVDPIYEKWGPKVEAMRAEQAAKGFPMLDREVVLKYLLGEAMLKQRGTKEGKREVRDAGRRIASQRTRPANSGSDTQAQRRPRDSVERRLENQQI
jgi:pyrroloquinoline quinone (PQQ) biosynthesis protein C